jgi:hypothetical protein
LSNVTGKWGSFKPVHRPHLSILFAFRVSRFAKISSRCQTRCHAFFQTNPVAIAIINDEQTLSFARRACAAAYATMAPIHKRTRRDAEDDDDVVDTESARSNLQGEAVSICLKSHIHQELF